MSKVRIDVDIHAKVGVAYPSLVLVDIIEVTLARYRPICDHLLAVLASLYSHSHFVGDICQTIPGTFSHYFLML